jgi:hypothetical protein
MVALEKELHERLSMLRPEQRQQVLEYARALGGPRRGVPGEVLLRFAGTLSKAEAEEFERAVQECQTIGTGRCSNAGEPG